MGERFHAVAAPVAGRIVTGQIADTAHAVGEATIAVECAVGDAVTGEVIAFGRVSSPAPRWIELEKKTALGVLQALGWNRSALEASGAWGRIVTPATRNAAQLRTFAAPLAATAAP